MAALFITLDMLAINKARLNLNEYLTLLKFKHTLDGKSLPFDPDPRTFERLQNELGYIQPNSDNSGFELSEKGIAYFKGDDLFEEFYKTFPHKVQSEFGFRPVSTTDPNSTSAKVTKGIWDKVVFNKPGLQRRIIDNLKKELANRKANNTLGYLHNIDTWLRQATWEKWDDVPDEDKKSSSGYVKL